MRHTLQYASSFSLHCQTKPQTQIFYFLIAHSIPLTHGGVTIFLCKTFLFHWQSRCEMSPGLTHAQHGWAQSWLIPKTCRSLFCRNRHDPAKIGLIHGNYPPFWIPSSGYTEQTIRVDLRRDARPDCAVTKVGIADRVDSSVCHRRVAGACRSLATAVAGQSRAVHEPAQQLLWRPTHLSKKHPLPFVVV